jgi:hypothetical protein
MGEIHPAAAWLEARPAASCRLTAGDGPGAATHMRGDGAAGAELSIHCARPDPVEPAEGGRRRGEELAQGEGLGAAR